MSADGRAAALDDGVVDGTCAAADRIPDEVIVEVLAHPSPLHVEVECGPIKNPVSGAEAHPAIVLPEGIILKQGDLGATTRFRVSHGVAYNHSGQYMAVGPFEYASR